MGPVHPAADGCHLPVRAVDDGVDVGEGAAQPVERTLREAGCARPRRDPPPGWRSAAKWRGLPRRAECLLRPCRQVQEPCPHDTGDSQRRALRKRTTAAASRRRAFPFSDATFWRTRRHHPILWLAKPYLTTGDPRAPSLQPPPATFPRPCRLRSSGTRGASRTCAPAPPTICPSSRATTRQLTAPGRSRWNAGAQRAGLRSIWARTGWTGTGSPGACGWTTPPAGASKTWTPTPGAGARPTWTA